MHPKDVEGLRASVEARRDVMLESPQAEPEDEAEAKRLRVQRLELRAMARRLVDEPCWVQLAYSVMGPANEGSDVESRSIELTGEQFMAWRAGQQSVFAFIGRLAEEVDE